MEGSPYNPQLVPPTAATKLHLVVVTERACARATASGAVGV